MRRISFFLFVIISAGALVFSHSAYASHDAVAGDYFLFVAQGCPHCAVVEEHLEKMEFPESVHLVRLDIRVNKEAAGMYNRISDELGIPVAKRGVPFLVAPGNVALFGDVPINSYFDELIEHVPPAAEMPPIEETTCDDGTLCSEAGSGFSLWLLVSAALADSINPCAFAVLILLMTSMLANGDRRRALATGLVFVATIFASYFAIGIGLYQALATVSSTYWLYAAVGVLAVLVGLFNLKDALWYGKGFLLEVPLSWRPRMKSLIRSIASPGGACIIALMVSLFLLPCTSGPYIVILGMLSQSALNRQAVGYLLLYNIIFILPMLILAFATYSGVSVKRAEAWRQDHVRTFHAVAGVLMLAIGAWVLLTL